jgi:hypothetical protein
VLRTERRVGHDGVVPVGGDFYNVPGSTVARALEVEMTTKCVRIHDGHRGRCSSAIADTDGSLMQHTALTNRRECRSAMELPMRTATKPRSAPTKTAGGERPAAQYASPSVTRALLGDALAVRNRRLAADDMVSTDEAAELAQTTRMTINAWIEKGRCIGLSQTKRGYRLPQWQFEPRMWAVLPKLSAALGVREGWALLTFLESPSGALNGVTPRVAVERGEGDRVLQVAAGQDY